MKRIVIIGILFFIGWSIGMAQSSAWDNNAFPSVFDRNAEAAANTPPDDIWCEEHPDECELNPPLGGSVGDGVDVLLVIAASTLLVKAIHRRRNKLRIIS